jgi:AmiR/NasT family two-component response regulator
MKLWVLQGKQGEDVGGLERRARQWARQFDAALIVERSLPWPMAAAEAEHVCPDIFLLAEPACPAGPWLRAFLERGVGIVAAVAPKRAAAYAALAEKHPVTLAPLPLAVDGLGLALRSTYAAVLRRRRWEMAVEQLQHRVDDRIVIERAKGAMVRQWGITEEEAYQRLRQLSRQERRPLGELAQALLNDLTLAEGRPDCQLAGAVAPSAKLA